MTSPITYMAMVRVLALFLGLAAVSCAASAAPIDSEMPSPSPVLDSGDGKPLAPLFVLPSASGGRVSLETYVGENNVVLVFYMGFW